MKWYYESTHEQGGRVLHLWSAEHREGYTAYALTHQTNNPERNHVEPPPNAGHYVGQFGLRLRAGIQLGVYQADNVEHMSRPTYRNRERELRRTMSESLSNKQTT